MDVVLKVGSRESGEMYREKEGTITGKEEPGYKAQE